MITIKIEINLYKIKYNVSFKTLEHCWECIFKYHGKTLRMQSVLSKFWAF